MAHTSTAEPTAVSRWVYRPALDGLRAVAVTLVVLFHARLEVFTGGFIGVDVFFVLSGFLVTGLLLSEATMKGAVDLGRFFARRVRRLLPASLLALGLTAAIGSILLDPLTALDVRGDFVAAALYVSNWFFIRKATDYFADGVEHSPVLHYWSLSVEEQFYFLWPLLLVALLMLTRRWGLDWRRLLPWVTAVGAVISLMAAVAVAATDVTRAYYGTDVRAYQLLAGASLAAWLSSRRSDAIRVSLPWIGTVALLALLLTGTSLVAVGPITRGAITTLATLGLIAAMELGQGSGAASALARVPMVWIGKMSYGLYLWHWPISLVILDGLGIAPWPGVVLIAVVSVAVASVSLRLVEMPIRTNRRLSDHNAWVIKGGLMASVAIAGFCYFVLGLPANTAGTSPLVTIEQLEAVANEMPPVSECYRSPVEQCSVVEGAGANVLVVGDSHAMALLPGFMRIAEERDWHLSAAMLSACPWTDVMPDNDGAPFEKCVNFMSDVRERVVPELAPDVVVLISRTVFTLPVRDGDTVLEPGTAEFDTVALDGALRAVAELASHDTSVAILAPLPEASFEIPECLSDAADPTDCDFEVPAPSALALALQTESSQIGRSAWIEFDSVACPALPVCPAIYNGVITRRDEHHLTNAHVTSSWAEMAAVLDQALPDLDLG